MSIRRLILEVRAWTEAERTASSSRRSANCRETSAGRESRDCVYSERRVRALAADTAAGSLVIAVASQEKRAEVAGPAFSSTATAISYSICYNPKTCSFRNHLVHVMKYNRIPLIHVR